LTGSSLSLETRICSLVDIFDALTSHRAYKPAMSAYDACHAMTTRMSQELDQELMRMLIYRLGPNARQPV